MVRLAITALAGIVLLGGIGRMQPPAAAVFILAGQSNMVGHGGRVAELDESLRRQPPTLDFFHDGVRTPMAAQPTAGPEFSLASELSQAMPGRRIVFIKYALGGVSLLDWAPEWDATRAAVTENEGVGPLYRNLMTQIGNATRDTAVEFAAVFWMQGERDARYPQAAAQYEANLTELIQRFRRDLKTPTLPFIIGQVNPPAARFPAAGAVRSAQARVAQKVPGTKLVTTDDLSKRPDGVHYDTGAQVALGRRFAQAYLASRSK